MSDNDHENDHQTHSIDIEQDGREQDYELEDTENIKNNPGLLDTASKNPYVLFIACFSSIGGLLFGYDQGVVSGILTMESFAVQFPRIYTDPDVKGWFVSTFVLCALIGSLSNARIADRYGRSVSMIVAVFIFVIGSSMQAFALRPLMLFAGRGIAGISVGMLTVVVPVYMAEIAPPAIRGALVVLQQLSITVGILISFWMDFFTNNIGGTRCFPDIPYSNGDSFDPYTDVSDDGECMQSQWSWRLPFALQMLPAVILAIGMMVLPESPRWLLMSGQDELAKETLAAIRRLHVDDEAVSAELASVKADLLATHELNQARRQQGLRNRGLLSRSIRPRVVLGSSVMILSQFMGINALIYYAPAIFASLGLQSASLLATGVYGIVNFLSTFIALVTIDHVGRRPLLIAGAFGCGISLLIVAFVVRLLDAGYHPFPFIGALAIYLYDVNFSYSWAPVGWVLPSEIFPIEIRSRAVAVTTSSAWISNFIVGLITPTLLANAKYFTYIIFAFMCAVAAVFTIYVVPETKGKTLEEMDIVFQTRDPL
ncbi:general substrate transporter [Lipomyces oligophaga]|uniref:general substrate transporter n=1 Tax=Lipomyces oligophaga TaxID=45792 RepID=UPI0034CF0324